MTRIAHQGVRDLRLQVRYGYWPIAAGLSVALAIALWLIGQPMAAVAGPLVLVVDTAAFGVLFAVVCVLDERVDGAFDALAVSPLRGWEYLAAKVGTLATLSLLAALPITAAAVRHTGWTVPEVLVTLLGVGLFAVLMLNLSVAQALRSADLMAFVSSRIWLLVPFLVAPVPHVLGIASHPVLYVVPTTGAADLIQAGIDPAAEHSTTHLLAATGYLMAAAAITAVYAVRTWNQAYGRSAVAQSPRRNVAPDTPAQPRTGRLGMVRAMARLDAKLIANDPMLSVILVGPVLLALALRIGLPPFAAFAAQAWGVEVDPYRPLLSVIFVAAHTPYLMGSLTAMLIVEDVDERHLLALRVTPLSLGSYLGYRLGTAAVLSFVGLVATVTITAPELVGWSWQMMVVVLLATATGPLSAVIVAALASNRVTAISMLKLLNLVPIGVPIAVWFLDSPRWILAPLPWFWIAESAWTSSTSGIAIAAVAGTVTAVAGMCIAVQRARSKLAVQ